MRTGLHILLCLLLVRGVASADEEDSAAEVRRAVAAGDAEALAGIAATNGLRSGRVLLELALGGEEREALAFAGSRRLSWDLTMPARARALLDWQGDREGALHVYREIERARDLLAAKDGAEGLRVLEATPARDDDPPALKAWWWFLRAHARQVLGSWAELRDDAGTAAGLARESDWSFLEERALVYESGASYYMAEYERMIHPSTRRLELIREYDTEATALEAIAELANIHIVLDDPLTALDLLAPAAERSVEVLDPARRRELLGRYVEASLRAGDLVVALEQGEALVRSFSDAPNDDQAIQARGFLGSAYMRSGRFEEAEAQFEQARALAVANSDAAQESVALTLLSSLAGARGLAAEAARLADEALARARAAGDPSVLASALMNAAAIRGRVRDFAGAQKILLTAMFLATSSRNQRALAGILGFRGELARLAGETEKAITLHRQALAIYEKIAEVPGAAREQGDVGALLLGTGGREEALALLEASRQRVADSEDKADLPYADVRLGNAYVALGRLDDAEASFQAAFDGGSALGSREAEVKALEGLARVEILRGRPAEALAPARRAIERLRDLVWGFGYEEAASVRESWVFVYETGVRAAFLADAWPAPLEFLEAGRAGALLEAVGGGGALLAAVLGAEGRAQIGAALAREQSMRSRFARADRTHVLEEIRVARRGLEQARTETAATFERVLRDHRPARELLHPVGADVDAVRGALEEGEVLLLYGSDGSDLVGIRVDRAGAAWKRLGPLEDIGSALLEAFDPDEPRSLDESPVAIRSRLLDPLGIPPETKRVLVAPYGPLHMVPFAQLLPGRDVALVPSATWLVERRRDAAAPGEGVLAVGGVQNATVAGRALPDLPASADEARAVGDHVLVGAEATPASLAEALARRARWRALHLACHGVIDPSRPLFTGLALSASEGDDGFLTVPRLLLLPLRADLVVLSACDSSRGKSFASEGPMGLSYACLQAGARRVVASLWKVDDDATALLMREFHRALRSDAGNPGLDAAAALRAAQSAVRARPEFAAPRFWAGWVLWGVP